MTIEHKPKTRAQLPKLRLTVKSRDLRASSRLAIGTYLQKVDVPVLLNTVHTCAEKVTLESIVETGLDFICPLRSTTIHPNEPPWFNSALKDLIGRRQRALTQGKLPEFRLLRSRVNHERKICRARYYEANVAHLKEYKPSGRWKEVKKLSGMSPASGGRDDIIKSLQHIDGAYNTSDLANVINDAFILPLRNVFPVPPVYCLFPLQLHEVAIVELHQSSRPRWCASLAVKRERRPSDKTYYRYSQLLLPGRQTTPIMERGKHSSRP